MGIKELIKGASKKEWWFVILIAVLMIIVTAVPYLYGYFTTPNNMVYTGIHHLTPGDTNVMLSMIEQVKQGENVFINPYTAEEQQRLYVNPFWLSVGWLGKIFNLNNLLTYHLARSIGIIVFIFVLYLFLLYLFKSDKKRKWVLLIVLFSSGLGIFFNPFIFNPANPYEHPTDIWVPESITFLTLYHVPHITASLTLIILIFLLMLLAFNTNKLKYSLSAGIACLFLLWFHPFNGPTIYLVLGTYTSLIFLWHRKIIWSYIKHLLILSLIPVPAVVYLYLISQADWVIRNWSAQNILPSPSVWMYLIGYGLLLPLVVVGLWKTFKNLDLKGVFLISWLVSSAMLLYIPLNFQRRLSEGLHIPLAILAALGILFLLNKLRLPDKTLSIKAWVLIMFIIVFLPLTNFQIMGQDFHYYSQEDQAEGSYYIYQDEVDAMLWLKENAKKDEITFSSYYSGNFIPAYSGRIVWIGHGPQTINLPEKEKLTHWFWENDLFADDKYQLLKNDGVDFVFYSRHEKSLGDYNPDTKDYLDKVFGNSQVKIYSVL